MWPHPALRLHTNMSGCSQVSHHLGLHCACRQRLVGPQLPVNWLRNHWKDSIWNGFGPHKDRRASATRNF